MLNTINFSKSMHYNPFAYLRSEKDILKLVNKSKVLFNLTKRQLICFGVAALMGVPLFFLLKDGAGTTAAAMVMILVMLPGFLFGVYEKNGQPLEVVLRQIMESCFKIMALTKLERIEREIEKTRGKITEYQNKLKELEAQRTEQENFEIVGIVRSMCMTRDELMNFLRSGGNDAPPAENVYHEQEDMTNDEE